MAPADEQAGVTVEVVFGPAGADVDVVPLALPAGSTLADALAASGLLNKHGLGAADGLCVGVWGRVQKDLAHRLRDRDRVEIYRPLTVDPKEARRLRYRGKNKA